MNDQRNNQIFLYKQFPYAPSNNEISDKTFQDLKEIYGFSKPKIFLSLEVSDDQKIEELFQKFPYHQFIIANVPSQQTISNSILYYNFPKVNVFYSEDKYIGTPVIISIIDPSNNFEQYNIEIPSDMPFVATYPIIWKRIPTTNNRKIKFTLSGRVYEYERVGYVQHINKTKRPYYISYLEKHTQNPSEFPQGEVMVEALLKPENIYIYAQSKNNEGDIQKAINQEIQNMNLLHTPHIYIHKEQNTYIVTHDIEINFIHGKEKANFIYSINPANSLSSIRNEIGAIIGDCVQLDTVPFDYLDETEVPFDQEKSIQNQIILKRLDYAQPITILLKVNFQFKFPEINEKVYLDYDATTLDADILLKKRFKHLSNQVLQFNNQYPSDSTLLIHNIKENNIIEVSVMMKSKFSINDTDVELILPSTTTIDTALLQLQKQHPALFNDINELPEFYVNNIKINSTETVSSLFKNPKTKVIVSYSKKSNHSEENANIPIQSELDFDQNKQNNEPIAETLQTVDNNLNYNNPVLITQNSPIKTEENQELNNEHLQIRNEVEILPKFGTLNNEIHNEMENEMTSNNREDNTDGNETKEEKLNKEEKVLLEFIYNKNTYEVSLCKDQQISDASQFIIEQNQTLKGKKLKFCIKGKDHSRDSVSKYQDHQKFTIKAIDINKKAKIHIKTIQKLRHKDTQENDNTPIQESGPKTEEKKQEKPTQETDQNISNLGDTRASKIPKETVFHEEQVQPKAIQIHFSSNIGIPMTSSCEIPVDSNTTAENILDTIIERFDILAEQKSNMLLLAEDNKMELFDHIDPNKRYTLTLIQKPKTQPPQYIRINFNFPTFNRHIELDLPKNSIFSDAIPNITKQIQTLKDQSLIFVYNGSQYYPKDKIPDSNASVNVLIHTLDPDKDLTIVNIPEEQNPNIDNNSQTEETNQANNNSQASNTEIELSVEINPDFEIPSPQIVHLHKDDHISDIISIIKKRYDDDTSLEESIFGSAVICCDEQLMDPNDLISNVHGTINLTFSWVIQGEDFTPEENDASVSDYLNINIDFHPYFHLGSRILSLKPTVTINDIYHLINKDLPIEIPKVVTVNGQVIPDNTTIDKINGMLLISPRQDSSDMIGNQEHRDTNEQENQSSSNDIISKVFVYRSNEGITNSVEIQLKKGSLVQDAEKKVKEEFPDLSNQILKYTVMGKNVGKKKIENIKSTKINIIAHQSRFKIEFIHYGEFSFPISTGFEELIDLCKQKFGIDKNKKIKLQNDKDGTEINSSTFTPSLFDEKEKLIVKLDIISN